MLRVSLRLFRPGTARSWKSGNASSSSKHFAFAHSSDRAPAHVKGGGASKQKGGATAENDGDDQDQKRPSDASRAASKYGNSFFALWEAINPARNFETIAKKPWLRRAVVWAKTTKLTEFGHISYFLGPTYVGTALGCTVAVVRESCDTLALQVPFIPLHLGMLHVLVLWSATSLTYIVQALVQQLLDKRRGVKKTETELLMEIKPIDGLVASVVHTLCVAVLLLWSQWSVIAVALYASPLMAFHFVTYRFPSPPAASAAVTSSSSSSSGSSGNTSSSSSSSERSVAASSAKLSNATASPEQQEGGEPSRIAMAADSLLLAIPTTMGYCAVLGRIDPVVTAPLAIAACSWGAMWHTFGGGKAVWFSWRGKKQIKLQQMIFTYSSFFALNVAGYMAGQTLFYYLMLAWAHWHMLGVIDHFRPNDPWSIAQARRRLRISVWLVFLAVCAGNVLWLLLVNAVSFVHDVEESDEFKLEEHKPFAETKKEKIVVSGASASATGDDDAADANKSDDGDDTAKPKTKKSGGVGTVVSKVLTMNVQPSPHSSMDQFSWMERIVKPVLVYATVQENLKKKQNKNKNNKDDDDDDDGSGGNIQVDLTNLEIPLCYKREFLGENVVYLMRGSGLFSEEQVGRFEEKYFSIIDHYTPFGSM